MCGILALGSLTRGRPLPADVRAHVARAIAALEPRGPDGRGVWTSPDRDVILGHTRLAIVDVDGGVQPMTNEDGSCVLVFNGELYGHKAQRSALEAKGHRFASRCDAEVALHLYEERGATTSMLAELRGEFAFAIWDAKRRTLFAARDRFGVKPLVYAERDGVLHVASNAKALFASGIRAAWSETAVFQAASMQYTLPTETLFEGVRVLPPGHFLVARDGHVRIERYWDLDYPTSAALRGAPTTMADAADVLRERLSDAVRVRLVADVPVAFQLSGGIDSSAVLALAHAGSSPAVSSAHAFTVSFVDGDARYDERPIAEEMARFVGAELHVVAVTEAMLARDLPAAIAEGEGFAINAHIAAKRILARAVRDAGFKVVLTGEGADEVLAGYAHLRMDLDATRASALAAHNVASAGLMLPHGDALDTSAIASALGSRAGDAFVPTWLRAKASLGHRVHALLDDDFARVARQDPFARLLAHVDVEGQLRGRGRVEQSQYLWSKLALEGYILRTLGDGMEMAASIEGRLPFLDHELFAFLRTLPTHLKIDEGVEKAVLRAAVGPLVTARLRARPKHPFLAPPMLARLDAEGSTEARRERAVLVDRLRSIEVPFLDRRRVGRLLDKIPTMTHEERVATEPALMFALSADVLHAHYIRSSTESDTAAPSAPAGECQPTKATLA